MKKEREHDYDGKELNKSLKLLVKTSFIVFIGLLLSKILGYAYRIIIARYYGPEVYGLFILALTVIGFAGSIASLGLSEGLLRYIAILRAKRKFDEIRYLVSKTLRAYFVLGIITSIILISFSDVISVGIFHNSSLSVLIKILGSITVFSLLMNVFITSIRAFEEIGWYSFVYNIFQNVARVLVLTILIILGVRSGESAVGISFAAGAILTFLASYFICRYKIKSIFGNYRKKDYSHLRGEFLHYSWPIVFYSIVSMIFYWIDTFSLGYYKTALEVGLYNAAVPIAMILGFVPELFMQLFFPMINKEYSRKNYGLIEQLSKQVTKWIFVVVLPIFVLLFLFPGAAINIIFGAQYLAAENALRLLLVGSFISSISVASVQLVSMMGKSKLVLVNIATASIINLILNSILVPMQKILWLDNSNGLIGAALATLISLCIFNLLFIIQIKRYLSFIPLRRKMISIALLSLIPIFVLSYLRSMIDINPASIILLALSFFLIYILLILIFRAFDKNDWMIINSILKKLFG